MYLFALLQHFTTHLHKNEKQQNKKRCKSSGLSLTFQVAEYMQLVGGEFSS